MEDRTEVVALATGPALGPAPVEWPEKYEPVRLIGHGGFGVVWQAIDRALQRPVALKFLLDARPADVERFRREARFAARLDDPAIVKVFELGEVRGRPYIAMEYVEGTHLGQAGFDRARLVEAIRTVARALDHAHRAGIVHRDIKPQNVLVGTDGRVWLTDFGIARDLSSRGGTLSVDGTILGTPALMPPEQARGEIHRIDVRSDVYALGAPMFLLLTGRMPFTGDHAIDVLHAVIHRPPPFPRAIDPSIPRPLEAIVLRCLRKDPRERYQNLGEFLQDLDRYGQGRPARSESADWFRALVGAPQRPMPAPATDPDLAAVTELGRSISTWDANLYRISSNICRTYPALDAIVAQLDGTLARRPDLALARFYRGLALFRRGRLDAALADMELAIDRVGELPSAHFELGRLYLGIYLREHAAAQAHLSHVGAHDHLVAHVRRIDQAVVAFEQARRLGGGPGWQTDFARAVERMAHGDLDGCVEVCDRVLAADADVEDVWKLRGDALRAAGRDPIPSYDRAAEIRRSFHEAHFAKAQWHFEGGRLEAARASLARAIEICSEYPEAIALSARTLLAAHRPEEARRAAERALALAPEHYAATIAAAAAELALGRPDAALERLAEAGRLEGCQNRVALLEAKSLLERGRLAYARGGDGRADLEAVVARGREEGANTSDNEPWRVVVEAAAAELDRRSRTGAKPTDALASDA